MLPDKFDGSTSWSDYLIHFESVTAINHWSEVEKAMFLASHLRRTAQEAPVDMVPEARKNYSSTLKDFK